MLVPFFGVVVVNKNLLISLTVLSVALGACGRKDKKPENRRSDEIVAVTPPPANQPSDQGTPAAQAAGTPLHKVQSISL